MAALTKVFSWYLLPNSKSDGAETLWKASGQHRDLENGLVLISKMAIMAAVLKIFKSHMLQNGKFDWAYHDGRHWGFKEIQNW